jgi:NAD(P) transhydrogenase subunit alpha
MRVVVPAEIRPGERRVALVPELVPRLVGAGFDVVVQAGAGRHAYAADDAYRAAGASVIDGDPVSGPGVVLTVQPLAPPRVRKLARGAVVIGFLPAESELELVRELRDARITSFAMELIPRISRAQSMDALSSQALCAGYRCVLVAAERLPRFFPLFMTAAGTVAPAKTFVLGAGVAGLQAIATARRLGAVVEAYDVRSASADEVRSLGATFIDLGLEVLEGAGGYAREMTEERAHRQRELLAPYVAAADVLITTAAVPGRRAPMLVTTDMVRGMRPGSVVVDLAAESGGNCEPTRAGEEVRVGDVLVVGLCDVPSSLAGHASQLYARNVTNLLLHVSRNGELHLDHTDEIVAGCCFTHDGQVRHEPTRALLQGEV